MKHFWNTELYIALIVHQISIFLNRSREDRYYEVRKTKRIGIKDTLYNPGGGV